MYRSDKPIKELAVLLIVLVAMLGGCQQTDPRVTLSSMQELYIASTSTLLDARQLGRIGDDEWREIVVYLETADAMLDDVEALLSVPHEDSDLTLLLEGTRSALRNITLAMAKLKEP